MCGICGAKGNGGAFIRTMNNTLAHRGPNEQAIFCSGEYSLGMSRLKIRGSSHTNIIGEFTFLGKNIIVLLNGEIYNYDKLKAIMNKKGFKLSTDLEIELIALIYAYYGERFPLKIDGMFAIAIVEGDCLFLCRDRLGIKPLYYTVLDDASVYFGSEIKAILCTETITPKINLDYIEECLVFGFSVSKTETPFEGIKQVRAGGYVKIFQDKIDDEVYYVPTDISSLSVSYGQAVESVKYMVESAVQKMFNHDTLDKGIYLSGGLDSSLIAILASSKTNNKLHTYTLTSGTGNANEGDILYAAKVANRIGSKHRLIKVNLEEALRNIVHFIYHYENIDVGGMFDLNGGLSYHILSGYVSKDVKVAFSGDGADELFAGYGKLHGQPELLIQKVRNRAGIITRRKSRITWTVNNLFPRVNDKDYCLEIIYRLLLEAGLTNYHLCCIDRSSSAYGFEIRPIFLDSNLYDYVRSLKFNFKVEGFNMKRILRGAFADTLAEVGLRDILERKKLAMPTALTALGSLIISEMSRLNALNSGRKGPYDDLFISPSEKLLFDLFYYLFIVKRGVVDYGKVAVEDVINEPEFKHMYN